ncbi:MAG TPA: hypothetical protein VKX49_16280 [Bryobacteraceae bacterium]|nr:hypothetical protein [Bryobacteraceae bacterium]
MTAKRWLAIFAVVLVAAGLGYAGLRVYRASQPEQCYACLRAIHAHSRTVAIVNGKPRTFCCPACALSEHEQEGKPIRVTELTSYLTGEKLTPDEAFIVKGSDVNMCAHARELVDEEKRPADLHYDRCSPSMLAFKQKSAAMEFARQHGGQVSPFSEIASAYAH